MNFSRRFYYILGAVVALPVMLFAAAALLIYTQSDTIKARILEEVNKNTGANASISGKVELSFFSHFPDVALELKGVTVQGSVDTLQYPLLKADRLYFLANFWDVMHGTWNIKSTSVENGEFSMLRMKNGVVNYQFKTEKDSTQPVAPFSIDVEKAFLKNMRYRLLDEIADVEIDIQVDDASVKGNFTAENLSLHTAAAVFSHAVKIKGIDYADEKEIRFEGSLAVMTEENSYALHIDKFLVEKNEFSVNGSITMVNDNPVFDLAIRGKDIAVKDIPFLLPAEYTAKLNGIKGSGIIQLSAEIKGALDKKNNPAVTIHGNSSNASLQIPGMDGKISGLAFKGTFTNGSKQRLSTSVLTVKDLTAKVKQGALDGSFVLTNFEKPTLKLDVDGVIDLSVVNKFLDDSSSLKRLGGTVNFHDVNYNGKISDLQAGRLVGMEGALAARAVEIVLAKQRIQIPEAKLAAYNKTLTIEKLDVKLPASQFSVSGQVDQVPGLAGNKKNSSLPPHAELTVRAESLNVLELFALMNGDEKAETNTKQQPMDFSGNVRLQANNVVYDKFNMYDVAGQVAMSGSVIKLQDFSCNAVDGSLDFNSTIKIEGDKVSTTTHATGQSINLKEMFAQFENFEQTTVTDKHISGTMAFTADVTANFVKGILDEKALSAVVDLTVKQGELMGMKSLENLSRFIDIEDLRHIRFSTLKNKITISNQTVHIPDMLVESNAINIALSGSQTFKGAINYSVRLNLFNVLGKKIRKRKDLTEYEQAGEDNFNFYLSLTGTTDNPMVKYDKRSIKERLAQQKEDFRRASALEPQYVDEDEQPESVGKGFKEKTIFTNKRQKEVKQEEEEETEFIEWDE